MRKFIRLNIFILSIFYFQIGFAQDLNRTYFDPSIIKIQKLTINTTYSEYSPSFFQNEILFSSNRKHAFGVKTYSEEDKDRLDDMYSAKINADHTLGEPEFIKSLNSRMQEGTSSFDSVNGILYYSATYDVKKKHCLAIYSSKLNSEQGWEKPNIVLFAGDTFSYFHPCIFNDGNSMILASDKIGGFGHIDLY